MKIPSKKIRAEFHLTYELKGVQKAVNFLCQYYELRRMKIVVDGRSIGKKSWDACYDNCIAYFRKKKINKSLVLHEFYHHLVYIKKLKIAQSKEEREANEYVKSFQRT
jgi:hypothetical protein